MIELTLEEITMPLWKLFGPVHVASLFFAIIILLTLYLILKKLPEKKQTIILGILSFTGIAAIIYNLINWGDPINYLPLHLCSLNAMLLPFAVFTKNKKASNLILLWSLGALFALILLPENSQNMHIFSMPFNFYYFPHIFEFGIPILLFALGLVELDPKCIKSTLLITFISYTLIHFVNLLINNAGLLNSSGELIKVSYMYSVYTDEIANPIFDLFYSIVPYDYWYLLLLLPFIVIYLMCWYLPSIVKSKKGKETIIPQKVKAYVTNIILGVLIISFCASAVQIDWSDVGNEENACSHVPVAPEELVVIMHAGGAVDGYTYLNSQEQFESYYNQGCRYFEYDLILSSDGRLVGTHAGEYLDVDNYYDLTYDEFTQLKLTTGHTPVNEEWLMKTLMQYEDVTIVVDTKMNSNEGDASVSQRIEALEDIYNYDLSSRIIPEVFSYEMWQILKDTTSFDRYFFSHYKEYYSVDFILESFADERICGIALSNVCDDYYREELHRFECEGKKMIFMFTPTTYEELCDAISLGAKGVYIDDYSVFDETK
jgi:glycerophosphoryl diester phosphodiesterase